MKTTMKICGTALALTCSLTATMGQLYVVNTDGNTIGEYGLNGSPINTSLITGLNHPQGVTIIGNDLFVVNQYSSSVAEYTTSGGLLNGSLISSGLSNPWGLSSSGSTLVVANQANAVISEYNTSGSLLNSITTTGAPPDASLSGGDIFIPSPVSGISEYNSSGTLINSFPTAPSIYDIAILGNDMFIPSYANGTIGEYTLSGGIVNASLITGLDSGTYIAVVPEPSTLALAGFGTAALWFLRRRK